MTGTKESFLGVSAPVVLPVTVPGEQRGCGLVGSAKGFFNLFASVFVSSIILQARSSCSSDAEIVGAGVMAYGLGFRHAGFRHASKQAWIYRIPSSLQPSSLQVYELSFMVKELKTAGGSHPSTFTLCVVNAG
eukprot:794215-Pelagomonas_calceolata.AAC.1